MTSRGKELDLCASSKYGNLETKLLPDKVLFSFTFIPQQTAVTFSWLLSDVKPLLIPFNHAEFQIISELHKLSLNPLIQKYGLNPHVEWHKEAFSHQKY